MVSFPECEAIITLSSGFTNPSEYIDKLIKDGLSIQIFERFEEYISTGIKSEIPSKFFKVLIDKRNMSMDNWNPEDGDVVGIFRSTGEIKPSYFKGYYCNNVLFYDPDEPRSLLQPFIKHRSFVFQLSQSEIESFNLLNFL